MTVMSTRHVYSLSYSGSLILLIVFAICWPPLGVFLFIKNVRFHKDDSAFYLRYRGSWFWAIFWAILFFPIAVIIIAIRGADVVEEIRH
jgi:uncharacterized membrane protein YqaE (UPF0057 family)